jgi:tetratricopeptide (TPR) repeat protein
MSTTDRILSSLPPARPSADDAAEEPSEAALKKGAFLSEYRSLLKKVKTETDDPAHHLELARFYIKHKYFKKAHSCLQVAKALQPRRIETHYLLGWLYQRDTNWEQARVTYRNILRLKPNEALARFHLGETLLSQGSKQDAYESLVKATELEPNLAAAYWHLGRLACERKDWTRALTHYQTLKNLEPANPDVYFELGNVFRGQVQTDRAVMAYQKACEVSPGHVKSLVALADLYLAGDLPTKSINILEELVKREAPVADAYLLLSRAYDRVSKQPQSLAALLQFQKAFPRDPRGHAQLARMYFVNGEHELAEEEFLKAIEISPDDKDLYVALGTLYLNVRAPTKAISLYRDLCARFPNDPQIYNLLGEVYDRFNRIEEAVEAFGHAIAGDPTSDATYCKRAKLYIKLGKYNEALRDFERAREINPQSQEARLDTELIRSHKKYQEAFELYSKGMEALKAGNHQQAMTFYRQILKLVPNNADWLREYLQLALQTGQFSEALATFEKLVAIEPTSAELLRRYAHLHYQLQNYEQARGLHERCVALSPYDAEARLGLLRALRHKLVERSLSPGKFDALVTAYEGHLTGKTRNLALLELSCLYLWLGSLVQPGGQWAERAFEYLDQIGGTETEDVARHKLLALYELHLMTDNEAEAIGALERLLRCFPHEAKYAAALLEHLIAAGQYPRAFRLSEEFKEKFPDNGLLRAKNLELFSLVAGASENPKNLFRNKIRALQQYVAANPEDWGGFFDLGVGLVVLTRPNEWFESRKKASIALNKAKGLAPASPWPWWGLVQSVLHEHQAGKLPVADRDRLISMLRNAMNLFPSEASFYYYLGRVLHRGDDPGQYEEGTRALVTSAILGDGFAPANYQLARHYHSTQDYDRAYHHYLGVLESVAGGRYGREVNRQLRRLVP